VDEDLDSISQLHLSCLVLGPTKRPISLLPYVLRVEHLGMDPLLVATERPRLADWLARVKARPGYQVAVVDWTPAPIVEMMRSQGQAVWANIEQIVRIRSAGA
jgi:hypothetical protein